MDRIVHNYYVVDNKVYKSNDVNYSFNPDTFQFYEVLRTRDGVLLLLDDHLERLLEAIPTELPTHDILPEIARKLLQQLVDANNQVPGNVKMVCRIGQDNFELAAYYIPHKYPDDALYHTGVHLSSFEVERPNPHLKQISVSNQIAAWVLAKPELSTSYEVLLVDHNKYITEGRRSNFFLIEDGHLVTAPDASVLMGITRKYVMKLARELGIAIRQKRVHISAISQYDAAFICGTSPKILPVQGIDNCSFNPAHPILQRLMNAYEQYLANYIQERS